jgi:hypothetical protein
MAYREFEVGHMMAPAEFARAALAVLNEAPKPSAVKATPRGKRRNAGILLTEVGITLPLCAGLLLFGTSPSVSDSALLWGGFVSFSVLLAGIYAKALLEFYRAGDLRKRGMAGFFAATGAAGIMTIYYLFRIASFAQAEPDIAPVVSRIFAGLGFVLPPVIGLLYWFLIWVSRQYALNSFYHPPLDDRTAELDRRNQLFIQSRLGLTPNERIAWIRDAVEQRNDRSIDLIRYTLGNDSDAIVRREAALALGRMRRVETLQQLEKVRRFDPHGLVQAAAATAIAQILAQPPSDPSTGTGDLTLPLPGREGQFKSGNSNFQSLRAAA